jgi:uncharacterized membrane protein
VLTSFVTVPVGAPATRARLGSIDLLRGLVMIVMVLDHTRDYVHTGGLVADPTNLATTTPMLFLTRWVTHYCAPIFVFLAGVGAYLQLSRGMTTRDLSRFLVTRGLWLVVLEFTVIRVTTWFNVDYSLLANFQVIWTLGVSMIVLAALIHLPLGAIAAFGTAMVVGHNAFDGIRVASWQGPGSPVPSVLDKLWILLHQGGEFVPVVGGSGPVVFVVYPLVPWIGVIALGYVCGSLYTLDPGRRQTLLRRIGLALIGAFIVIRATNIYGDPRPWAPQGTLLFSVFSFINTTKYPVSLLYLLMTIGPALLALAWFESRPASRVEQVVTRVGRVPLFFYLWQWPFAHGLAVLLSVATGKAIGYYFMNPPAVFAAMPPDAGFDLPIVYLCWAVIIAVLIPMCLWFARVKASNPAWWLKYL